jgi:thiol-disulfide isomerase/thioredoxin
MTIDNTKTKDDQFNKLMEICLQHHRQFYFSKNLNDKTNHVHSMRINHGQMINIHHDWLHKSDKNDDKFHEISLMSTFIARLGKLIGRCEINVKTNTSNTNLDEDAKLDSKIDSVLNTKTQSYSETDLESDSQSIISPKLSEVNPNSKNTNFSGYESESESESESENDLRESKKAAVLYFSSDNCPYCIDFNPVWQQIRQDHDSEFLKMKFNVNSSENKEFLNRFGVKQWPTIIIFKKGKTIDLGAVSRLNPDELWNKVKTNL